MKTSYQPMIFVTTGLYKITIIYYIMIGLNINYILFDKLLQINRLFQASMLAQKSLLYP